ncbi:SDR family oxidoreductase [Aquisalimonas lutea]|uniref:SDR family oxidoreductase n=1 Tax=Aquisalimonas lutea TaxID=1327750 RepID=UPI0025B592A0|nr:SDR family oxidoreductase [Aquisalimonas lutea]MDN3516568.1 SDR family oxidoreductase [Aquisalimonas lutea]
MSEAFLSGVPEGLRVLVTAGAGGIGRAIAETFVAHGARVHVCDVSQEALDDCLAAGTMTGSLADVGSESDVDHLFEEVQRHLGGLDVLVNNAGLAGPTAEVEDIDAEAWCRTVDVNLSGHFFCTRRAAPLLKQNGDGAIINIASVAGRLGYASRLPYAATKWGIVGVTASLAKELGPYGIRVNAILPGIVEGPRMQRVIAARAEASGVSYEAMEQQYLSRISLRRMVSPQDVADMALFLCSRHGRNVSGQPISVCGNVETL